MKLGSLYLISLIFLAGCTTQVQPPEVPENRTQITPETPEKITKPETKSTQETASEVGVTTGTVVEIKQTPEQSTGPKTFQVTVTQGIGIKEGSG